MTRRTNALLRDYVDLLAWSAEVGHITTFAAACRLARRVSRHARACLRDRRRAGRRRAGRARRDPALRRRWQRLHRRDDWVDGSAYMALACECIERELALPF